MEYQEYQGLLLQTPPPVLLLEAPKPRQPRTIAVGFQIEAPFRGSKPRASGPKKDVYFWRDANGDHIRVHTDVRPHTLERLVSLLNYYSYAGMAVITLRPNGWYAEITRPEVS